MRSTRSHCTEKPVHPNYRAAPAHCNWRKAHAATKSQCSQKINKIFFFFLKRNTGAGCHVLLRGLPDPGIESVLPASQVDSSPLSHPASPPRMLGKPTTNMPHPHNGLRNAELKLRRPTKRLQKTALPLLTSEPSMDFIQRASRSRIIETDTSVFGKLTQPTDSHKYK